MHNMAPIYLRDFIVLYEPTRSLRSETTGSLLKLPRTKLEWNALPKDVR